MGTHGTINKRTRERLVEMRRKMALGYSDFEIKDQMKLSRAEWLRLLEHHYACVDFSGTIHACCRPPPATMRHHHMLQRAIIAVDPATAALLLGQCGLAQPRRLGHALPSHGLPHVLVRVRHSRKARARLVDLGSEPCPGMLKVCLQYVVCLVCLVRHARRAAGRETLPELLQQQAP